MEEDLNNLIINNENIVNNSKRINKDESQNESKKALHLLTPLESFLLNKKMPHGFKFETEENLLKISEIPKNQPKRIRQPIRFSDNLYKTNNRNYDKINIINQQKIRNNQKNYNIENLPKNVTPTKYKEIQKCLRGLNMIKDTQWIKNFYQSNHPDIPCLSNLEKKVNNYEYETFYDFAMDVRKIWYYYFSLGEQDNNNIYDITSKMSDAWEQIYSEIENTNDEYSIANNIKKRTEKKKEYNNEYIPQYKDNENITPPSKKVKEQNNENKPMSLEEKNILGNLIRSLNKEQLKGIVKLLSNNNDINTKYFEFDIDTLPIKKLRELEKYVKNCLNMNNNINKINSKNRNINENIRENQNIKNNIKEMNTKINSTQNEMQEKIIDNKEKNEIIKKSQDLPTEHNRNNEPKNDSFSESDSISSESSLSN